MNMFRNRLSVPGSVVINDRIHRDEQNLRFWRGVFADALKHQERRRAEREASLMGCVFCAFWRRWFGPEIPEHDCWLRRES